MEKISGKLKFYGSDMFALPNLRNSNTLTSVIAHELLHARFVQAIMDAPEQDKSVQRNRDALELAWKAKNDIGRRQTFEIKQLKVRSHRFIGNVMEQIFGGSGDGPRPFDP